MNDFATSSPSAAHNRIKERIEALSDVLLSVSHRIHENPELGYEEHFAHDLLTETAESAGLEVQRSACGLETAFVATAGRPDGPTVAVLCEYDALPGIGHACGHNIIAAAGLGAGVAAAEVADELGGRLVLLGTPAEESGGGKIRMLRAGAFEGVDAALMLHPAGWELLSMTTLAISQLRATYRGTPAHAAAAPEKGRNALDAAVLGYVAAAALRQHITPSERIHGIITNGGQKPNIVPALAQSEWYARSPESSGLARLKERLAACLRSSAEAAGVEVELETIKDDYHELISNPVLERLWAQNAGRLNRKPLPPQDDRSVVGSTDMGNVSAVIPSIHPMIAVSPPDVAIHTQDFAEYARGPQGDRAVIEGARILAGTVIDYWCNAATRQEAAEAFADAQAA